MSFRESQFDISLSSRDSTCFFEPIRFAYWLSDANKLSGQLGGGRTK